MPGQVILCVLSVCRGIDAQELTRDLETEFELARQSHIVVVDGRRALYSTAPSRSEPLWVANGLPGGPVPVPAQDLGFRGRPKVVVIFVHGYRVGPTEALQHSSALWRHIRESNEQLRKTLTALPETDSVAFLTFLWRGDFVLFSDSQQAAKDTAPAFVDFLKTVLREAKGARIVIVTHSLGAEVVLEALGSAAGLGSVVNGLILVQAAVPAYLLSRWTVSFQTGSDLLADAMIKPENREECRGRYAIAIRSVKELVYTFSAKDEVLSDLFRVFEVGPAIFRGAVSKLPVIAGSGGARIQIRPLGVPYDTKTINEIIQLPAMQPPFGKKQTRPSIGPTAGDVIFTYTDWKIDHAHAVPVDISLAKDTGTEGILFRGHSILFQREGGLVIVKKVWELIADTIGETQH